MNYRNRMKTALRGASLIITGAALLILNACNEEPTFLGRDLLPPTDEFYTRFFDGESISSAPSVGKPILTSVNTRLLLGTYNDSIFGKSKAEFMVRSEVFPRTVTNEMVVDSMILYLLVNSYYGDSLSQQMMRIYEMTDSLGLDSSFYSNENMEGRYNPDELGHVMITPLDSIVKVRINDDRFREKFETAPDSIYKDLSDYLSYFPGFYFTTDDITDKGAIIYYDISANSSRFHVYYRDDTTGTKDLAMTLGNVTSKVNIFSHDYTGSRSVANLDQPEAADSLIFISAMGGLNTRIHFPEIENWLDSIPVAINNALLYVPADTSGFIPEEEFPAKIFLFSYNDEDVYEYVYDFRIDSDGDYFNGKYDAETGSYVFNIGVQLQSYINGDIEKMDMIMVAGDNSLNAKRVILFSAEHSQRPMKLKITYTRF